jgi:WD40 repeat protein
MHVTGHRGTGPSGAGETDSPAPKVAVIAADADRQVERELSSLMRSAGVELVATNTLGVLDGIVVLLSARALADPAFCAAADGREAVRILPVRLEAINADAASKRLRYLNWIDWTPANPSATFGSILAGLLADPARHRLSRELLHEAEAWDRAKRPRELLIEDHTRAAQMQATLEDLQGDPLAHPSPLTVEFVKRSAAVSQRAHRRRRRWRIVVLLAALGAAAAASIYIPEIQAQTQVNHAAIATTGDEAILAELPEWSAVNASELLLEGTTAQQTLGRDTLLDAMQRPWSINNYDFVEAVTAITPFANGTRAAVLTASPSPATLAVITVGHPHTLWSVPLHRAYDSVFVVADGSTALLSGAGVASINLSTHMTRTLLDSGTFSGVWGAASGQIVIWSSEGTLQTLNLASGRTRQVGRYRAVLDVAAGPGGQPVALVAKSTDQFELVRVSNGAILASARIASVQALGTLSPSGTRALIAGADGQLWTFGVGEGGSPTGIASPVALNDISWTEGERVVLASDSERGQVYYLPRQELLGPICSDVPRLQRVTINAGSQTAACVGTNLASVWSLVTGPRARAPGESNATTLQNSLARVQSNQAGLRVFWSGALGNGSTNWFTPSGSTVTALAFSPDGHEIVVGSAGGEVTLVGLAREDARVTVEWHVPDSSPVTAVGWQNGPVASTASGQTWAAPSCSSCATDTGLLDAARERFTGCFTERQVEWVITTVRRRLGIRVCPATED